MKELDVALAISLGMKCRPGQADADTLERLNDLQMELERTKAELKEAKSGPDYKLMYDQLIEKMFEQEVENAEQTRSNGNAVAVNPATHLPKTVIREFYWAREVTFDYATTNAVRVDFMKFKPVNNTVSGIEKGDFYCYEVKSSVDDFHSKNGHNFLGDYNYYVMPEGVYEQVKKEIPYQVGVYVPDGMNYRGEWYDLKAIKKAKRKDRSRPVSEMLLMMFRSAARDRR